jgi:hypothetical protein
LFVTFCVSLSIKFEGLDLLPINILAPVCSISHGILAGFKEITRPQKETASVLAKDQMMGSIEKRKGSTNPKRIEN